MSDRLSPAALHGKSHVDLGRVNPQTGTPMLQPVVRCQGVPQVQVFHSKVRAR